MVYTALLGAVDSVAANFLTFSVPVYILIFAVVFIVLGKILGITEQLAAMIFLTAASASYLMLTAQLTVGTLITMSDIAIASGVVITGFVLAKVMGLVFPAAATG